MTRIQSFCIGIREPCVDSQAILRSGKLTDGVDWSGKDADGPHFQEYLLALVSLIQQTAEPLRSREAVFNPIWPTTRLRGQTRTHLPEVRLTKHEKFHQIHPPGTNCRDSLRPPAPSCRTWSERGGRCTVMMVKCCYMAETGMAGLEVNDGMLRPAPRGFVGICKMLSQVYN